MSESQIGILTIIAIITGPLFALWLQRWTEDRRERRKQRLWVFRTLMMYRATALNPNYVQALNLIDVTFNEASPKEKEVRRAWKVLIDHLSTDQTTIPAREKTQGLTADLLIAMGRSLGYDFDEVQLKRQSYRPVAHAQIEEEQAELRRLLLMVLRDQRRIPVAVFPDEFAPLRLPSDRDPMGN